MKVRFTLVAVLCVVTTFAFAQRYAVASGDWNSAIWAATPTGIAGSAAIPTSGDDVFTNGFNVSLSSSVECRNLNVRGNEPLSLNVGDQIVTIYGLLTGASSSGSAEFPSVSNALVMGEFGELVFVGSGTKINRWKYQNPLTNVTFDPGTSQTCSITTGFRVDNFGIVRLASGSLSIPFSTSREIRGCADCSLIVESGTTLTTGAAINGGSAVEAGQEATSFGHITISGTVAASNYVNGAEFSLSPGGVFSTAFVGANQTEGWWYQSVRPSSGTIATASTISFNAVSDQNVYSRGYGNLLLDGGNKTMVGASTLNITGDLTINTSSVIFNSDATTGINISGNIINHGTWNPADKVIFNGTGSQQIGGTVSPTFSGGLEVNKTGGALSLVRGIDISNGLSISRGIFDASIYTTTLSGSLNNSGTLSFGTGATLGTLVVNGTTAVSGTVPSFGHLTINSGSAFSSAGTINVAGDVTNNGTFEVNGIVLNGTSAQRISGTLDLTTLTIKTGANVSNLGTVNIDAFEGLVRLEGSGIFHAGAGGTNTLRLRSTSVSDGGRIASLLNPDAFSGNVTVERFISAPEDWEYLAFPVANPNVGMLKDDISVTGSFSDASPVGGNVTKSTAPSIYYLNAGWQAVGSGASTASTPLSGTVGYSVWSYVSSGLPIDVDGEINKGPTGVAIRSGDNLVPNPYPSAIDWDNVSLAGANLSSNTIYVRTANGQYASYVNGTATGNHPLGGAWGGQLATGQAFWVLGAGNGTLTFQEDDKTSSTNFVREAQPKDFMRIRLKKDTFSDDAVIRFIETATLAKDKEFDAPKKLNDLALNIATYNVDPAIQFAINGVPYIDGCEFATKVALGSNNPEGDYSLVFEDMSSMQVAYNMVLVDKFLRKEMPIAESATYAFSITSDPSSGGVDRFEIVFKTPEVDLSRQLHIESLVDCDAPTAKISINNSQPGISYQFVIGGSAVTEPVLGNGSTIDLYIAKEALTYGLNSLNLLGVSQNGCNSHEFANAFSIQYDAIPEATALSGTPVCNEGTATLNASGAPENGFYRWYESEESVEPIAGASTSQYITSVLSKSKTYFVSAVNANGCEGARVAVPATVTHLDIPEISVQGDIFSVPDGLGSYQWYMNEEPLTGANSSTFQVKKSGSYSVGISSDNCSVVTEVMEFLINGNEHKRFSDLYSLYPNPVQDILTIQGPDLKDSKITVYDRSGQQLNVSGRFETSAAGESVFVADLSHVKNGAYLLNIESGKRLIQLKVIKR